MGDHAPFIVADCGHPLLPGNMTQAVRILARRFPCVGKTGGEGVVHSLTNSERDAHNPLNIGE